MTTSAISAFGTLLKIGDGAQSESFTTIAEVTNIRGPNLTLDTVDVTSHSSTESWKEYIATCLDAGDVSFDINFIPTETTHSQSLGLLKDMKNKTKRNFQLVFPNTGTTTWSFAAYITAFSIAEPHDNALTASVTLKITGKPTLAG